MANTKIVLDRQATAQNFEFGTTNASGQGSVTIRKGTLPTSTTGLTVEGSAVIGGDLNLVGNLNITGSINETSVNNLSVTDLTIRVNKGGTTAGAATAGLQVEGDSAALIGSITFDNSLQSKFSIGNGTTQREIIDISSPQTLTNKSISGGQITSAVALATLASTVTTNANLFGDVTSSGNTTTISNNAVTLAKFQQIASQTVLGRGTAGTGNAEVLTLGSGLSITGGVLNTTGGAGTVTSVSVVNANGISGSVANASTTPAITLTLGAITPSSINGLTLASQANGFTISGGTSSATLTIASSANVSGSHSGTSSGTNSGDQTITLSGAITGSGTGAITTTLNQYFRQTTVSGTQDSSNKTFSISNSLLTGSEIITQNGQTLTPGSSNDYVLTGTNLVFQSAMPAPTSTDVIQARGVY